MAANPLTPEQVAEMHKLYESPLPLPHVAARLGICLTYLKKHLREHPPKKWRCEQANASWPPKRVAEMHKLYESPLPLADVAARLGISLANLKRRLQEFPPKKRRNIRITAAHVEMIQRDYGHKPAAEIAKAIGCHPMTVKQIAVKYRISGRVAVRSARPRRHEYAVMFSDPAETQDCLVRYVSTREYAVKIVRELNATLPPVKPGTKRYPVYYPEHTTELTESAPIMRRNLGAGVA